MKRNTVELSELSCLRVIDIGASGGIHERWSLFPHQAVLVEPDPREVIKLRKALPSNTILIETALSDQTGERDFYLYRKQQCSSVYKPNIKFLDKFPEANRFEIIDTIRIKTDLLSNQLKINDISDADFIKLDAEGHELAILRSAGNILDQVIGMEIEVYFCQFRLGNPLFPEVFQFVAQHGFELVDLRKTCWCRKNASQNNFGRKGQLILGDSLFFRSPENILLHFGQRPSKILSAIAVYLCYGYFDFAHELYMFSQTANIFSKTCLKEIGSLMGAWSRANPINFKMKKNLLRTTRWLSRKLATPSFASGDDFIGNRLD